jgi:DNA-binding NarL/FixJ family response regulator
VKKTWPSQSLTGCGVISGDAPHLHLLNLIAAGIPASVEFLPAARGSPCRRTPRPACAGRRAGHPLLYRSQLLLGHENQFGPGAPPDPLQPLSPRERDVLRLIARGHRQIARDLAIGEQTVKTHVAASLPNSALRDCVQAAIFALCRPLDSHGHQP